jgi:radical SAM-linked protein
MSLAMPLTLGFESLCEYLEFETDAVFETAAGEAMLSHILPEGIEVISLREKPAYIKKTLAAAVNTVEYDIIAPHDGSDFDVAKFMAQPAIIVEKVNHKKNKTEQLDIKPFIENIEVTRIWGKKIMLHVALKTKDRPLNPLLLIDAIGKSTKSNESKVLRTNINF